MPNTSYINDASNFDELWNYVEKAHVYGLLNKSDDVSDDDGPEEEIDTSLSTSNAANLQTILNLTRQDIDSILTEKYNVDTLTYSNCPQLLKDWNARFAVNRLEKRRYRSAESQTESYDDLVKEVTQFALESTSRKLSGVSRRSSPLSTARVSSSTQFDRSGQFGNVIPPNEYNDTMADGFNA